MKTLFHMIVLVLEQHSPHSDRITSSLSRALLSPGWRCQTTFCTCYDNIPCVCMHTVKSAYLPVQIDEDYALSVIDQSFQLSGSVPQFFGLCEVFHGHHNNNQPAPHWLHHVYYREHIKHFCALDIQLNRGKWTDSSSQQKCKHV